MLAGQGDLPDATPTRRLIHAANEADRVRRGRAAMRWVTTAAPYAAGSAAVVTAGAIVFGLTPWVGILALGVFAIAEGFWWVWARRPRPLTDMDVTTIDRDASLGGALRSGWWFATTEEAAGPQPPRAPWVEHHVSEAAERVTVAWTEVYPPVRCARSWAIAAGLAALTLAMNVVPLRTPPRSTPAARAGATDGTEVGGSNAAAAAEAPAQATPDVPQLFEAFRAMRRGDVLSPRARGTVEAALEAVRHDPTRQAQLQTWFDESEDPNRDPRDTSWLPGQYYDEMQRAAEPPPPRDAKGHADLQWALEEAVSRSAAADRAASRTGDTADAAAAADPTQAGQPSASVPSDSAGQVDQPVTLNAGHTRGTGAGAGVESHGAGDEVAARAAARAATANLAAALRREVVQAAADVAGPNVQEDRTRRATEPMTAASGTTNDAARSGTKPASSVRAPRVPEARAAAVRAYFNRLVVEPQHP